MAARRRRVRWAEHAQRSLDEALEHIAQESPSGAAKVLHAALDLASSLETLSERGRVVPEVGDPTIRELFVYSYRLIYEIRPTEVTVLGFIHGARDFARWKRRQES